MKNFQGIKSKDSFRVKYIHASFLYTFILWIESKYDRSKISIFHSQRAHFLSCLLRKKKKVQKLEHPCPMWKISSEQPLFLRFLYLFIHYISEKVRIEISIEIFSHIIQPSTLNFIFLIFLRIFFFLSFFIPSSRSCATLKYDRLRFIKRYALPPPEKNPSRRGCSLINNPLSVFFSFFFRSFYRPRAKFSPPRLSFYPSFFSLSSSRRHRKETHATSWRINAKHRTD